MMMPYIPTWNNPYTTNNPFGYQQVQPTTLSQPFGWQSYQQQTNGITKVKGPNSAMQYPMGPNSISPALFDENGKVFYVVSTDGTGTKSLETFDYSPHIEQEPAHMAMPDYVSRAEFQELVDKVSKMDGDGNGTHEPVQSATA